MLSEEKYWERFWARANEDPSTGCWVWTGRIDRYGYAVHRKRGGHTMGAYRIAYEYMVAEVPPGLQLDHLCRNRTCINPYHLEPVTLHINNTRKAEARTQCDRGHEYTERNTRIVFRKEGLVKVRVCRACAAENARRYRREARDGKPGTVGQGRRKGRAPAA